MNTRLLVILCALSAIHLSGCCNSCKEKECSTGSTGNAVASAEPKVEVLPSGLVLVNDESYSTEIASGVSLVNISAKWCRPCAKFAPIVEELAKDFNGTPKVAKANFDDCPILCGKFEVNQIPATILFKDGQEVARFTGLKSKEEVKQWVVENTGSTVAMH
jgi:thioredoxin 1